MRGTGPERPVCAIQLGRETRTPSGIGTWHIAAGQKQTVVRVRLLARRERPSSAPL